MSADCIFCQIVGGRPTQIIVYRDEEITAFWDRRPGSSGYILVVPNKHIHSVNEAQPEDAALLGRLVLKARDLAKEQVWMNAVTAWYSMLARWRSNGLSQSIYT